MSKELMTLADLDRIEDADFWLVLDADHISIVQRAINTARAAHRLQKEVKKLKKENASLQAMRDIGVSFHNLKCAELDLAFCKMDKLEVENEELRKDAGIGKVLIKYIDRLNDPTEEDTLLLIVGELCSEFDSTATKFWKNGDDSE